jgi:hypothetical protein
MKVSQLEACQAPKEHCGMKHVGAHHSRTVVISAYLQQQTKTIKHVKVSETTQHQCHQCAEHNQTDKGLTVCIPQRYLIKNIEVSAKKIREDFARGYVPIEHSCGTYILQPSRNVEMILFCGGEENQQSWYNLMLDF